MVQIYLRATIKTDFMYTDYMTPVDFLNHYNIASEIEKKKEEEAENAKRSGYMQTK